MSATEYTIGPFVELGPNEEPPDCMELVADETCCSLGEKCCGWNGRYATPIGVYLTDPDGVSEHTVWGSTWYHPQAPDRPVCEDCAQWITDDDPEHGNPGACPLCMVGGPAHEHVYIAEQERPVACVLTDPESGDVVVD